MNRITAVADVERSGVYDAPRSCFLSLASGGSWGSSHVFCICWGTSGNPRCNGPTIPVYFLWFTGVFLVYVIALLEVWRRPPQPHPYLMPLILGWAVMFRLSVLWVTPGFLSDDIYRYVWDGLVQHAGINPYHYPPEAPELGFLRDDTIFPMINRKWALTIYPPAAQLFFRALAWLWPGQLVAMKTIILLADVGSIALLLCLLKQLHLPQSRIVLYAWHPLVVVELGISGHLDGLMLPFVLLAWLCMMHNRSWLVGVSLAIADADQALPRHPAPRPLS